MQTFYDIKDGLLKLILFTNIDRLYFKGNSVEYKAAIRLTSDIMQGNLTNYSEDKEVDEFVKVNSLKESESFCKIIAFYFNSVIGAIFRLMPVLYCLVPFVKYNRGLPVMNKLISLQI